MSDTVAPIDAFAVALDETANYEIAEKHRPYIKRIMGVYLFDRNQRIHCCELTPSYYLIHLYDQVILTEAGEAMGEEFKDDLHEEYEHCGGENIYVHCSEISKLIDRNEKWTVYYYGDPEIDYEDSDYDDQMEGIREYLCANCPF